MNNIFYISFNYFIILYRKIYYRIKGYKLDIIHTSLDAPIAIIGQPNRIKWEVNNLIYAKIIYGVEKKILTTNGFSFLTSPEINRITITFYGIDKSIEKTFDLFSIDVKKNPPPQPFFVKQEDFEFKPDFLRYEICPNFSFSLCTLTRTIQTPTYRFKTESLNIRLTPIDLSHVNWLMYENNREQNIKKLTNKLNDNDRFLQQSDSRSYYEIAMESRWF